MANWESELYQNDMAYDIRGEFEELFHTGKGAYEITNKLIEDYKSIMGNPNEEPLFWLALSDTQWELGVLLPFVKESALSWLNDKFRWSEGAFSGIRAKLLSPQPPMNKTAKKRVYKCQWNIGDVFAYQLESDFSRERGLFGRYLLIRKVGESTWYPGHILPIVYIKITEDASLPSTVEEYNRLEYVQTWFTKFEDRFLPIDMHNPQKDIAQKSLLQYEVDEFGYLPQFRAILLNTSKAIIPAKLIYVGNFADADAPKKEFVPHVKENIVSVAWKQGNETFETKILKRYCGHNLRELSIYTKLK